jgi:SAM-dependent methyltransferase
VRLFSGYVYQSGTSLTFREHFQKLALKIVSLPLADNAKVLEIGSNDGILLKALEEQGLQAFGLEPSTLLVDKCRNDHLKVVEGYLDEHGINEIRKLSPEVDVVIGNNVFAHIDDMNAAFEHVYSILIESGLFIFEVAHLLKLVEKGIFDTIYHEHMSYHSVFSLKIFLENKGFSIVDVEEIPTHGGSIRVIARKGYLNEGPSASVIDIINREVEAGITVPAIFSVMAQQINLLRDKIHEELKDLSEYAIYGYGAPAKLVTFISEMDLEQLEILAVVDDNPDKQGKFLPRSGFEVISSEIFEKLIQGSDRKIVCFIFPWNLGPEIMSKLKMILPPESRVVTFFPSVSSVRI